jgi:hypothetical protein
VDKRPWRKSALALCGFALLLTLSNAHSGVISGTGRLTWGEWDFSECKPVNCYCGDIIILDVFELGLVVMTNYSPALVVILPDSSFEDLKYAPEDSTLYDYYAPYYPGRPYVVRTLERHYAKFRFMNFTVPWDIEYVYQPDGSRKLFDEIATEKQTWGAIKSLFP